MNAASPFLDDERRSTIMNLPGKVFTHTVLKELGTNGNFKRTLRSFVEILVHLSLTKMGPNKYKEFLEYWATIITTALDKVIQAKPIPDDFYVAYGMAERLYRSSGGSTEKLNRHRLFALT